MHSSRIHTVRCSSRLLGGGVSARGGVCLGGCLPRVGVCPGGCLPRRCLPKGVSGIQPPPPGQNDRCLWKHYLTATTLRTVNMSQITEQIVHIYLPCLVKNCFYSYTHTRSIMINNSPYFRKISPWRKYLQMNGKTLARVLLKFIDIKN